ncbi:MAG: sigma-70 family RNA polymerase sigma factor [Planctomycetota bacterium]
MEASLLQSIARGEAGAVERCLDAYGGLVWSLARRFADNRADAEDAVQEIFADVWANAGRFDPSIASETTFVAMIARRRLIDRRRRDGRVPRFSSLESAEFAAVPEEPQRAAELRDEASRIRDLFGRLRPEQQQALRLSICEGLTHQGVSETMGLPLGTIKTHIRRGLIAVRELLIGAQSPTEGGAEA